MGKDKLVFGWMLFLLATNTGVLLTMLRERVAFRVIRERIAAYLPPGYDPSRLSYPFLFDRLAPPSWRAALAEFERVSPEDPHGRRWRQFQKLRSGLMLAEIVGVLLFVVWMVLA